MLLSETQLTITITLCVYMYIYVFFFSIITQVQVDLFKDKVLEAVSRNVSAGETK